MESGQGRGVGGRLVDLAVDADQTEVEDHACDHQYGDHRDRDDDRDGTALVSLANQAAAPTQDAVHVGCTSRP
jgi:hypothetical protein